MKLGKILNKSLNEMAESDLEKALKNARDLNTPEKRDEYINAVADEYIKAAKERTQGKEINIARGVRKTFTGYKNKNLIDAATANRIVSVILKKLGVPESEVKPKTSTTTKTGKSAAASKRGKSGHAAEIELRDKIIEKGGTAEIVHNRKVTINLSAEIGEEKFENFSQSVLINKLEEINELERIDLHIKNFNPVKWDIEVEKGANNVFGFNIPNESKIEVKDTSKTITGKFLYAEVYKVSDVATASRIKQNERYLRIFNKSVRQVSNKINEFIKEKLEDELIIKRSLINSFLARKQSVQVWEIEEIDLRKFVNDIAAKINDGYFRKTGEIPGGVSRVEIYFKKAGKDIEDYGEYEDPTKMGDEDVEYEDMRESVNIKDEIILSAEYYGEGKLDRRNRNGKRDIERGLIGRDRRKQEKDIIRPDRRKGKQHYVRFEVEFDINIIE